MKAKIGKRYLYWIFGVVILFVVCLVIVNQKSSALDVAAIEKDFVYLSDIPYIKEQSQVGWGNLTMDSNLETRYNNGLISLIVNGEKKLFLKGISAHATSTVVFDISNYSYDYFSTYYGVDASRNNSDGVKFAISTSTDGENWDLHTLVSPPIKKGDTEAEYINVDIKGKKYIKLYCLQYGSATSDHCAYGNAKLYKEGYVENPQDKQFDFIKTIEEYDSILKNSSLDEQMNQQELVLLQRELVKNVGYELLREFALIDQNNENTLRWLMTNVENLRLYILGGAPTGGYISSLKQLVRLYISYKDDFTVDQVSKYGNNIGDLYKRMAIALSLTHSSNVSLWMQPSEPTNQSDSVERYRIFKWLYDEGKFIVNSTIDINKWFESYTVEELRVIMNNIIDDESIIWLNAYTQKQIEAHPNQAWTYLTPHPYMAYVWPNYGNAVFHDPNRKEYWDNLYDGIFSKYGVTYSEGDHKVYKVWMNFRNEFGTGAVCGGISKTGSNIRTVHGIPAAVIGQPGHAAIIYYSKTADNLGYWGIDNDVSGWALSEKGERMPLGWGNDRRYVKGYNVPYIIMAQEAINRFDQYQQSQKIVMLSNLYQNEPSKQEEYLWSALEKLDFNIDAWYNLIVLYNNDSTKTEEDYYQLAIKLSEALLEYPFPYNNLMALLAPHFQSTAYQFNYTLLLKDTLTKGKNYNGSDVLQPSVTRGLANYLLGIIDTTLATFSFDGENHGKIVLGERFNGSGVRFDYSLDGKNTWKEVSFTGEEEHKHPLTNRELASITAENDIYIHIVGAPYNDQNILKIDILENVIQASSYFRNDLENRVIGVNLTHEWRNSEDDPWTSYAVSSPDNTGDKTLQIRVAPTGVKLASNVLTFNFTEDNQPDTRKYIPVSHLSIHSVSTQATAHQGNATYAIDGNYNTRWHSNWNGNDQERYITIKFDREISLSAMDYVPAGGGNGKILNGQILGSLDGENFFDLTTVVWANNETTKTVEFDGHPLVQYIKIVGTRTSSAGGGNFIAARYFNFYQDLTQNPHPTAGVAYDTVEPTNGNVVARLVNPSTKIKITNNNGSDTYVFTENGEFTFEFVNEETGSTGQAIAKVNWIDKIAPTASIVYNTKSPTNREVTATLIPDEEIIVLNNGDYNSDNPNADPLTYYFLDNGEFTFEFMDKAGNRATATASVSWIDKEKPRGSISYSTTELTNKDVVVEIIFNKENVTVLNNNGSTIYTFSENGEFTFEYVDEAGNMSSRSAYVNWIDKVAPNASVSYDITTSTKGSVVATITSDEYIEIVNNDGSNTYVFNENGSFDFVYQDKLGNVGVVTASVTWINKGNQGNQNPPTTPEEKPSEPSTPTTPDESKPGEEEKPPIKDKSFTFDGIKLVMPSSTLKDDVTLKGSKFILTNELERQFGKNSRYIELYLENENHQKVNVNTSMKLIIPLDKEKEFLGIYEVVKNDVRKLKYKKNNNQEIELEVKALGKYVVYYKQDEKTEEENYLWYIIGGTIFLIGSVFFVASLIDRRKQKRKRKEEEIPII